MTLSFIAPARTYAARFLDRRVYTAHTQPTAIVGPVSGPLSSDALTAETRVQCAQVIDPHLTRVWPQRRTSSTQDPPTYMSHA